MSPMQSIDGTPPTQRWVPQTEPLDLNEPLGRLDGLDALVGYENIQLEDLDPDVQHRIESWPEAAKLLQRIVAAGRDYEQDAEGARLAITVIADDAADWLAANAPEES